MDQRLRDLAYARSGGYCESCGTPVDPNNWAFHHRKLKSRGGKDTIENALVLHHHCHNVSFGSVHQNPTDATRRGLMVSSWDDPATTPVTLDGGRVVLLLADGTYLETRMEWQENPSSPSPGEESGKTQN